MLTTGAAWIHGLQGNPLTQIAQNNGFQLQRTDYNDNKLYSTNGQVMPLKLEWLLDQQFDDFLETASRFQNTGVTDTPLQVCDFRKGWRSSCVKLTSLTL